MLIVLPLQIKNVVGEKEKGNKGKRSEEGGELIRSAQAITVII